jgi:hypothetical protein
MNFKGIQFILILFVPFLFYQCTSEYIDTGRVVCFQQEVYPLLVSSCTQSGCHNSNDFVRHLDYTSVNDILRSVQPGSYKNSRLYSSITDPFRPMPPSPYAHLTKDQITTISLWIVQGAHTMDSCKTEICDTSFVTYSGTIKPVMDIFCNGCHMGSNPQGGIDFNSFAGIKASIENGQFIASIKHESGYIMPKNGNKLSDCKIALFEKWVNEGAPNN